MLRQLECTRSLREAVGARNPYSLLRVDGTPVAVAHCGSGIPVICLHAAGQGSRDYAQFASVMSLSGFAVFMVDWPGHGASPPDATGRSASAERYADLLAELIPDLCGESRPILLGNSIGGAAALSFALRHPGRIRGLVLCNPGGLAPLNGMAKSVIGGMVKFFEAGVAGARWFPQAFAAYYRLVLPGKPAASQRERIVAAGPEMALVLREAWDSFRQPEADLRALATKLTVPVLFAWARQDRIVAWSRSRAAVSLIPGREVQMFSGGHSPFLEDPDVFNAAFLSFVERVTA